MKLTSYTKMRINSKLVQHAYEKLEQDFITEENFLAEQIYFLTFPNERKSSCLPIKTYGSIMMKDLPDGWLEQKTEISVNAGGYSLYLSFKNGEKKLFPYSYRHSQINVVDQILINKIQSYAHKVKLAKEEKTKLRYKIESFLRPITTINKFFEKMPEAENILGKDFFGGSQPCTDVTTIGKEILCVIAKVRDEPRDGCCDGQLIQL